jgi:hypothetical protein
LLHYDPILFYIRPRPVLSWPSFAPQKDPWHEAIVNLEDEVDTTLPFASVEITIVAA